MSEKKYRLFGKIPVVDLLIVGVLLAALAGGDTLVEYLSGSSSGLAFLPWSREVRVRSSSLEASLASSANIS